MIGKSTIKLIKSLAITKYRKKENLFLVEGDKNVNEVLKSNFFVNQLFATRSFLVGNAQNCKKAKSTVEVEHSEIKKVSLLKNPQNSLALCELPPYHIFPDTLSNNLSIYLDDVQDPGNVGTIIRICDWFKVEYLFCSPNTADLFNPKVIQASMGSFCRIKLIKTEFESVANLAQHTGTAVYGAFLDGKNIYTEELPVKALLIMGNEGNGIQNRLEKSVDKKIKIPGFSKDATGAESLNVATATAIICSEFKRGNCL